MCFFVFYRIKYGKIIKLNAFSKAIRMAQFVFSGTVKTINIRHKADNFIDTNILYFSSCNFFI